MALDWKKDKEQAALADLGKARWQDTVFRRGLLEQATGDTSQSLRASSPPGEPLEAGGYRARNGTPAGGALPSVIGERNAAFQSAPRAEQARYIAEAHGGRASSDELQDYLRRQTADAFRSAPRAVQAQYISETHGGRASGDALHGYMLDRDLAALAPRIAEAEGAQQDYADRFTQNKARIMESERRQQEAATRMNELAVELRKVQTLPPDSPRRQEVERAFLDARRDMQSAMGSAYTTTLGDLSAKTENLKADRYYLQAEKDLLRLDEATRKRVMELPARKGGRPWEGEDDSFQGRENRAWRFEVEGQEAQVREELRRKGFSDEQIDRMLDVAQREYDSQIMRYDEQRFSEFASRNPGLALAASVPMSLMSGIGAIDQALKKLGSDKPLNFDAPSMWAGNISSALRAGGARRVEDSWAGPVGSFLYQTAGSMLDSGATAAITAATGLPAAYLLGGSAATSAMVDAKSRGASDSQAVLFGILSGAAEEVFEEISIEKLLSLDTPKDWRGVLKNTLKQSLSESSEEVNTSLANMISDALVMGDKSELQTRYWSYLAQGMGEKAASTKTFLDTLGGLGLDALGGAISGGVMAGTSGGVRMAQENIGTGRDLYGMGLDRSDVQAFVDEGLAAPEGSRARQLGERYQRRLQSGRDLSSYQLGRLYQANVADVDSRAEAGPQDIAMQQTLDAVNGLFASESPAAPAGAANDQRAEQVVQAVMDAVAPQEAAPTWRERRQERREQKKMERMGYDLAELEDGLFDAAPQPAEPETREEKNTPAEKGSQSETVRVVQRLQDSIPELEASKPVSDVSTDAVEKAEGRTMAEKARKLFSKIVGIVNRSGFGDVEINGRSIKDDLSHGVGAAKAAVIPSIPDVIRFGTQIGFQEKWKGRAYDGYVFAAPVNMDGKRVYVAAVVKQTSKNRFYLHEVVDSNGEIIKISNGERANPTSLATGGDAGTQSPLLDTTISQQGPVVNGEDSANPSIGAADAGFDPYSQWQNQTDKFHPEGEKADRLVEVPVLDPHGLNTMRTGRTLMESANTPDERVRQIERLYVDGALSYVPQVDADLAQKASETIQRDGWVSALTNWTAQVQRGRVNADLVAMGATLLNDMGNSDARVSDYADLVSNYSMLLHNAGQALQAARVFKMLTPEGRLYCIQRSIDSINEQLKRENGVEMDKALMDEYRNAATDEARDAALDKLMQDVADKVPATLADKWTALRYVNMLGNFKTQARNVLGNTAMGVMRSVKNEIAAGIEAILQKAGMDLERTKSARVGREWMRAASADFQTVKDAAMGNRRYQEGSPGQIRQEIDERRRIFSNPVLEGYRKLTNWGTDAGDVVFIKHHYARSLAGYLKANGVSVAQFLEGNVDAGLLDRARSFAIREAQEATFHDNNVFSDWVSRIGRRSDTPKVGRLIAEGVAPFRKTPANVLVRAYEYSPLGVINTIRTAAQTRSGNATASDVINSAARALTGTGLLVLGMALRAAGHIRATSDDGDEEIDGLMNRQDYALVFGDKSYTMDWLSPSMLPVFMGGILQDVLDDNELTWADVDNVIGRFGDPLLNMSMLSGVDNAFNSVKYFDNGLLQLAATFGLSYMTQGLTNSLVGQIERTTEGNRMTTYTDQESDIPVWLQKSIGQMSAKIPGWDYQQAEYQDEFGETESNGEWYDRLFQNVFSPGYYRQTKEGDQLRATLEEVHRETGKNPFPSEYPEKRFTQDGVTYELTPDQRQQYQRTRGQSYREIAEGLAGSDVFQQMDAAGKAKLLAGAKELSNAIAKHEWADGAGVPLEKGTNLRLVESGIPADVLLAFQAVYDEIDQKGRTSVSDKVMEEIIQAFGDALGQAGVDEAGSRWETASKVYGTDVSLQDLLNVKDSGNRIKAGNQVSQPEAGRVVAELDRDDAYKAELWGMFNSSWGDDKNPFSGALHEAGVPLETNLDIMQAYSDIFKKDMSAREKETEISHYFDGLDLSDDQRKAAEDTFGYFNNIRANPEPYNYHTMTQTQKKVWDNWANKEFTEAEFLRLHKIMADAGKKDDAINALADALGSRIKANYFWKKANTKYD